MTPESMEVPSADDPGFKQLKIATTDIDIDLDSNDEDDIDRDNEIENMSEPELRRELAAAERLIERRDNEIHQANLELQHERVSLESVTHIHDNTAMEADHQRTDHSHDSVTDHHSH